MKVKKVRVDGIIYSVPDNASLDEIDLFISERSTWNKMADMASNATNTVLDPLIDYGKEGLGVAKSILENPITQTVGKGLGYIEDVGTQAARFATQVGLENDPRSKMLSELAKKVTRFGAQVGLGNDPRSKMLSELVNKETGFDFIKSVYNKGDLTKAISVPRIFSSKPEDQITPGSERLKAAGLKETAATIAGAVSDVGDGLLAGRYAPIAKIPVDKIKKLSKKTGNWLFDKSFGNLDDIFKRQMRGSSTKSLDEYPSLVDFLKKEKVVNVSKEMDRSVLAPLKQAENEKMLSALKSVPESHQYTKIKATKKTIGGDYVPEEVIAPDILSTNKKTTMSSGVNESDILDNFSTDILGKKSITKTRKGTDIDLVKSTRSKETTDVVDALESAAGQKTGRITTEAEREAAHYEDYLKQLGEGRTEYKEAFSNPALKNQLEDVKIPPKDILTVKKEVVDLPYKPVKTAELVDKSAEGAIADLMVDIDQKRANYNDLIELQVIIEAAKKKPYLSITEALGKKRFHSGKVSDLYKKRNIPDKLSKYVEMFDANLARGYKEQIRNNLKGADLKKFDDANKQMGLLSTLDDIEKQVAKTDVGSSLNSYDQSQLVMGNKLGLARTAVKFLDAPTRMRKMGLGLMSDNLMSNMGDVLGGVNKIRREANPYLVAGHKANKEWQDKKR